MEEVMNMIIPMNRSLITEYDEEKTLAFLRKESYDDGVEEATVEHVINLMETMNLQVDVALDALKIPEERRPAIKVAVEEQLKEKV
jgi:hypothetical protein